MYDRFAVKRVLVVAPLRVAATVWTSEAAEWEHLRHLTVVPVLGSLRQRLNALAQEADIYTINRENVDWLVNHYGRYWPFDMVVLDESSGFKNHLSKRFRALRRIRPWIKRLVELTGTPAPNGLMDLWSQIYLLDGGERLGKTIGGYRRRWFSPGRGNGYAVWEWNPAKDAESEIYEAISDICVSMKAEDYISLPPIIYNTIKIPLPEEARKAYKKLEKELVLAIAEDETITATSAAVLSNKLLQMASGSVYDEKGEAIEIHAAKLEALAEVVEANNNKPLLVFYWFRHDLERLQKQFPEARKLDTVKDIEDWNAGKVKMLLAHPASAGHGLNLQQGGNAIVWFSLTWSLELYQQANKRLHRSGQRNTVVVHHLVAEGTIDQAVLAALSAKKTGQDGLLAAIKAKVKEYEHG
ncbi:MAG: DEAD/DEAH box helicase [Selenomonadaceae bacterium]|nr:DEAD/DEAH box helicase [Selenomonadaceae bacterium]